MYTQTRGCLMALCPGLPGWAGTRKVKPIWLYWSKIQWVAVASTGLYASLHLAPDRWPCHHPTPQFFTGWMPFLPPNQRRQCTEGYQDHFLGICASLSYSMETAQKWVGGNYAACRRHDCVYLFTVKVSHCSEKFWTYSPSLNSIYWTQSVTRSRIRQSLIGYCLNYDPWLWPWPWPWSRE